MFRADVRLACSPQEPLLTWFLYMDQLAGWCLLVGGLHLEADIHAVVAEEWLEMWSLHSLEECSGIIVDLSKLTSFFLKLPD